MRIKCVLSYDGSEYFGFQIQKDESMPSIQKIIQETLSKVLDQDIKIYGSGRTDRGVHALNQVFHFDCDKVHDLDKLKYALNKILPDDILIKSLEIVDDSFHSRFSVKRKHYRYIVIKNKNPFYRKYALFFPKILDLELMKEGMNLFLGTHCFKNFCSNKDELSYQETIYSFTLKEEEDKLYFDIEGSGFKRHMVRMIVGSILALGVKQIDLDYIKNRLDLSIEETTSYKANGHGLYLMEVIYD